MILWRESFVNLNYMICIHKKRGVNDNILQKAVGKTNLNIQHPTP